MKQGGTRIFGLAVITVALIVPAFLKTSSASACSCGPQTGTPEDWLAEASAVFSGTVNAINPASRVCEGDPANPANCYYAPSTSQYPPVVEVLVDVDKSWKGAGSQAVVYTNNIGATCGYPFEIGTSYLVYAYSYGYSDASLQTSICTPTKLLSDANEDLSALNNLSLPPTGEGAALGGSSFTRGLIALLALSSALISGTVLSRLAFRHSTDVER
jgi:hypothetical protein